VMVGIGALASRLGWFVMFLGGTVFYFRLLLREEAELLRTQGASYRAYFDAVPRLWPSLSARVPSGGMQPRWAQAIRGELMSWSLALAIAVFTFTLRQQAAYAIILAGLAIYVVQNYVLKKSA